MAAIARKTIQSQWGILLRLGRGEKREKNILNFFYECMCKSYMREKKDSKVCLLPYVPRSGRKGKVTLKHI